MATDNLSKLRAILARNGHHITRQRTLVFQLLHHPEPQSMKELIRRADGRIDRVSIYRTVDLFEKLGIVTRVNVGWKYKLELADEFVSHHHHLICLTCGKTVDIKEQHVEDFVRRSSTRFGFTPIKHSFEIEGYCDSCKANP